jgi:thiol:disulfide interchange protein DsbD
LLYDLQKRNEWIDAMRKIFTLILCLVFSLGFAAEAEKPLNSDQAFVLTSYTDKQGNITFQWHIAPGYFLYQNKFHFKLSPAGQIKIGAITWPRSLIKNNDGMLIPIYSDSVTIAVPLKGVLRGPVTLTIGYQGCSRQGFCYAPIEKNLKLDLSVIKPSQNLTPDVTITSAEKPFLSDQVMTEKIFAGHNVFFILLSFLGLGLLLAFTPCVLPMIPILSGIIVGHKKNINTVTAFSLSFSYVMGMAVTYAAAGILVASLGSSVQALFQQTWIIILFSVLFILLSFSLFGFYDLRMPAHWQKHTTHLSNRLKSGSYVGVFFMGCLSTLIVSPCVSAPLVGVLAYIAQTGDRFLGGMALLMMGLGMGIPLLLIGTSAGKWLPKAGHWMTIVKKLFGVLMLGVAIWMLSRIISGTLTLMLWSFLFVGTGVFLGLFCKEIVNQGLLRIIGSCLVVYGIILVVGAAFGNSDPLRPWNTWNISEVHDDKKDFFITVKTNAALNDELKKAKEKGQPVILDFYATWCVSCVAMDHRIFNQLSVREILSTYAKIRVDITENNAEVRAILKRYHVIAPPTILFFDKQGREASQRIIGEVNMAEFLNHLDKAKE